MLRSTRVQHGTPRCSMPVLCHLGTPPSTPHRARAARNASAVRRLGRLVGPLRRVPACTARHSSLSHACIRAAHTGRGGQLAAAAGAADTRVPVADAAPRFAACIRNRDAVLCVIEDMTHGYDGPTESQSMQIREQLWGEWWTWLLAHVGPATIAPISSVGASDSKGARL